MSVASDDRYAFPERKSQPGSAVRNSPALREQLMPLLLIDQSVADRSDARKAVHVLEVGSGEGEQLATLAADERLASTAIFQPTEADTRSCDDVDRRCQGLQNVRSCAKLDIDRDDDWKALRQQHQRDAAVDQDGYAVALVINVIHIVPYDTVLRLFAQLAPGAGIVRSIGGRVILYGAFHENGRVTSEGNAKFDQYLKDKNHTFGLRDLQNDVVPLAQKHGFHLDRRIEMPAGNLLLVFEATPPHRSADV